MNNLQEKHDAILHKEPVFKSNRAAEVFCYTEEEVTP